jgi:hypothetical protein
LRYENKYFHVQILKDRAGEQIDKLLLKNVIDKFVEIGMGDIKCLTIVPMTMVSLTWKP